MKFPKIRQHQSSSPSVKEQSWIISKHEKFWDVYCHTSATSDSKRIYFDKEVAPGYHLNTPLFSSMRQDLEKSYCFLMDEGYINKSNRLPAIHNCIVNFVLHINEQRISNGKNLVLGLNQIKKEDFLRFIKCFAPSIESIERIINEIKSDSFKGTNTEWNEIEKSENISRKEFSFIRNRIVNSKNNDIYTSAKSNSREYRDANQARELEELHLPNLKTIKNVTGDLDLLFKASVTQTNKFSFSTVDVLASAANIFDVQQSNRSTPAMPLETTFHLVSKAAEYCHKYGVHILAALKNYDEELSKLKERYAISTLKSRALQKKGLSSTSIPAELDELNITCFGYKEEDTEEKHSFNRNGMSLCTAIQLYFASLFILLSAFLATRKMSIHNLKRSCFNMSALDDLYEVVFKQLKSKDTPDSYLIRRPIHGAIYKFGLQLVELSKYVEERHQVFHDDDNGYLFTNFLNRSLLWRLKLHPDYYARPSGLGEDTIQSMLDLFSDWCECPLYSGKRWYCTPHQLRRVFAVFYFNFTDEAGIEELSWMLGHDALEVTFGYAEVHPDEDWIEEAVSFLSKHAKEIISQNNSSDEIRAIVQESETACLKVNLQLENVIYDAINKRIAKTGEEVHFKKLEGGNIYFYFTSEE